MEEAEERLDQVMLDERAPELEFGSIYTGKIVSILDRGVMIQLHPALDPILLPNNQLGNQRIAHPSALGLTVGQDLQVQMSLKTELDYMIIFNNFIEINHPATGKVL